MSHLSLDPPIVAYCKHDVIMAATVDPDSVAEIAEGAARMGTADVETIRATLGRCDVCFPPEPDLGGEA